MLFQNLYKLITRQIPTLGDKVCLSNHLCLKEYILSHLVAFAHPLANVEPVSKRTFRSYAHNWSGEP
jgi:hypothetical protein